MLTHVSIIKLKIIEQNYTFFAHYSFLFDNKNNIQNSSMDN